MNDVETKACRPCLKSFRDWLRQIFFGLCMGAADIVPGISGGSMALILGIYEELIFSVKSFGSIAAFSLLAFRFKTFSKVVAWDFILGLVIGILFAMATLSHSIQYILGDEVYRVYLYALFNGLIVASVFVCKKQIKVWKARYLFAAVCGAVATFILTGASAEPVYNGSHYDVTLDTTLEMPQRAITNYDPSAGRMLNVSASTLSAMLAKGYVGPDDEAYNHATGVTGTVADFVSLQAPGWVDGWLIACGAIAISAMLLPGISGSYLLTVLGAYPLVIGAIADFVQSFDTEAFFVLMNVGIGIVAGALLFSRVIAWLLKHHHATTLSMLIGFMIGALRTVWPFWSYEYLLDPLKLEKGAQLNLVAPYVPQWDASLLWISVLVAIGGFVLVYTLETVAAAMGRTERP